ncbi:leucine-rich repeat domain-containing protein, partial [Candidatus Latescibacterota bacterium]
MNAKLTFALLLVFTFVLAGNISAEVPLAEKEALEALYNSTDGANWTNNTNWLTSAPVSEWYGVSVTYPGDNVTKLDLSNNNLSGTIPPEIGNLKNLYSLNLGTNQLTGSIPPEIGTLVNLRLLYIHHNPLQGSIPPEIGNLTILEGLYLSYNQLSGSIPPEIGMLTKLRESNLNNNQLTGSIPPEIGMLTNLTFVYLNNNQLTGSIPPEISMMTNLEYIYLNDNQLTGSIPPEIGMMTNLWILRLQNNQLTGSIPLEIGMMTNLRSLWLSNNQFTDLPCLSALASLNSLKIENNKFTFEDIEPNIGLPNVTIVYSPQDSVSTTQEINVNEGESLTVSVSVGGDNNKYQWKKDGTIISGAASSSYTINSVNLTDAGSYICEITNTVATNLTLYSRSKNVTVTQFQSSITLTSPNGPESWTAGTTQNITWTQSGVTSIKLEYSTDSGANWSDIAAGIDASAGSYAWIIPDVQSATSLVRISDESDASVTDMSIAMFTIAQPNNLADSPWPKFHKDLRNTGRVTGTEAPTYQLSWRYLTGGKIASSAAIESDGTLYFGSHDGYFYAVNTDGSLKWRYQTGVISGSSPVIAKDGTIYFSSQDSYVYALNADGTLKWRYLTDTMNESTPTIAADGTIIIGSHRKVYALNPDGTLKWIFNSVVDWNHQFLGPIAIGSD